MPTQEEIDIVRRHLDKAEHWCDAHEPEGERFRDVCEAVLRLRHWLSYYNELERAKGYME